MIRKRLRVSSGQVLPILAAVFAVITAAAFFLNFQLSGEKFLFEANPMDKFGIGSWLMLAGMVLFALAIFVIARKKPMVMAVPVILYAAGYVAASWKWIDSSTSTNGDWIVLISVLLVAWVFVMTLFNVFKLKEPVIIVDLVAILCVAALTVPKLIGVTVSFLKDSPFLAEQDIFVTTANTSGLCLSLTGLIRVLGFFLAILLFSCALEPEFVAEVNESKSGAAGDGKKDPASKNRPAGGKKNSADDGEKVNWALLRKGAPEKKPAVDTAPDDPLAEEPAKAAEPVVFTADDVLEGTSDEVNRKIAELTENAPSFEEEMNLTAPATDVEEEIPATEPEAEIVHYAAPEETPSDSREKTLAELLAERGLLNREEAPIRKEEEKPAEDPFDAFGGAAEETVTSAADEVAETAAAAEEVVADVVETVSDTAETAAAETADTFTMDDLGETAKDAAETVVEDTAGAAAESLGKAAGAAAAATAGAAAAGAAFSARKRTIYDDLEAEVEEVEAAVETAEKEAFSAKRRSAADKARAAAETVSSKNPEVSVPVADKGLKKVLKEEVVTDRDQKLMYRWKFSIEALVGVVISLIAMVLGALVTMKKLTIGPLSNDWRGFVCLGLGMILFFVCFTRLRYKDYYTKTIVNERKVVHEESNWEEYFAERLADNEKSIADLSQNYVRMTEMYGHLLETTAELTGNIRAINARQQAAIGSSDDVPFETSGEPTVFTATPVDEFTYAAMTEQPSYNTIQTDEVPFETSGEPTVFTATPMDELPVQEEPQEDFSADAAGDTAFTQVESMSDAPYESTIEYTPNFDPDAEDLFTMREVVSEEATPEEAPADGTYEQVDPFAAEIVPDDGTSLFHMNDSFPDAAESAFDYGTDNELPYETQATDAAAAAEEAAEAAAEETAEAVTEAIGETAEAAVETVEKSAETAAEVTETVEETVKEAVEEPEVPKSAGPANADLLSTLFSGRRKKTSDSETKSEPEKKEEPAEETVKAEEPETKSEPAPAKAVEEEEPVPEAPASGSYNDYLISTMFGRRKPAKRVEEPVEEAAEAVEEKAAETVEAVEETAAEAIETVEETAAETFEAVEETAAEAVETAEESVAETVETVEETAAETFEAVEETAAETVETAEETVAETVEAVEETAAEAVETAEETAAETFEAVEETAAETVETAEKTVTEAIETAEETAADTVETVEDTVAETFEEATENVTEAAEAAEETVAETIEDTVAEATEEIAAEGPVAETFGNLEEAFAAEAAEATESFADAVETAEATAADTFETATDTVEDTFAAAAETATDTFETAAEPVTDSFGSFGFFSDRAAEDDGTNAFVQSSDGDTWNSQKPLFGTFGYGALDDVPENPVVFSNDYTADVNTEAEPVPEATEFGGAATFEETLPEQPAYTDASAEAEADKTAQPGGFYRRSIYDTDSLTDESFDGEMPVVNIPEVAKEAEPEKPVEDDGIIEGFVLPTFRGVEYENNTPETYEEDAAEQMYNGSYRSKFFTARKSAQEAAMQQFVFGDDEETAEEETASSGGIYHGVEATAAMTHGGLIDDLDDMFAEPELPSSEMDFAEPEIPESAPMDDDPLADLQVEKPAEAEPKKETSAEDDERARMEERKRMLQEKLEAIRKKNQMTQLDDLSDLDDEGVFFHK